MAAIVLGNLYSSGKMVKQSYADAMTWYQKAEQIATGAGDGCFYCDGGSAIRIEELYENGLGVSKDRNTATSWYQKAAGYMINRQESRELIELLNFYCAAKADTLPRGPDMVQ